MSKKEIKPWVNGPFKINYEPCPPINYEPGIDKPVKKILNINNKINNNIDKKQNNKDKIISNPPWREANAMSHDLFLWNDRNSRII